MKCQSVACIWSDSPPLHRVTATAVLNQPPTLYTGGSDGSIIWWSLSSSHQSNQKIWPLAMLCGHASTIADLDICFPVATGGHGETENTSNVVENSSSDGYGALISACTDGVLCIWSRGSGHCKLRRKMPPWVGSPSAISTLPSSPRYVCVACCSVDSVHGLSHQYMDPAEGGEAPPVDRESHHRRASKCAVVIVDSYSLNIVQTVFHGSLSIGPLKFMALVSSIENKEKQSVIVTDGFGGVQSMMIYKESDPDRKGGNVFHKKSSQTGVSVWADGLGDGDHLVSISFRGELLALIYRTHCEFRLGDGGVVIGEMSLIDSPLCDDSLDSQSHLEGGMFLVNDDGGSTSDNHIAPEQFVESFAVWSSRGAAIVFTISVSENRFNFEPVCEIPAISHPLDMKLSICFDLINGNLLRIESICSITEESSLWRPRITVWLLCQQHDTQGKLGQQCRLLGEGGFLGDWVERCSSSSNTEVLKYSDCVTSTSGGKKVILQKKCDPRSLNVNDFCQEDGKNNLVLRRKVVSSSMVLLKNSYAPYAVVYGFYTGEIEIVQFGMFYNDLHSLNGRPHHVEEPHVFEQSFSGHTGPILCLAAHRMVGNSNGQNYSWVLISGSMDCTIRVWDLNTSELITVMHHHVAPVRQIILPPPGTDCPWSDCFLSVGEDSCVTLASLETLRVERMFPGHPNYPAMVVWDSLRGYIACLCKNHLEISNAVDVLYLWDVKTGARERVLRGTASHSMFDNFCRGVNINSITGNVLGGITSASSLVLPILMKDAQYHSKNLENGVTSLHTVVPEFSKSNPCVAQASKRTSAEQFPSSVALQTGKHPIKCSCPFPGIAALRFDLSSLMFPCQSYSQFVENSGKENPQELDQGPEASTSYFTTPNNGSDAQETTNDLTEGHDWVKSAEGCLIRFSLSFLHLWGVDHELDRLLISEMNVIRPENFIVASGLQGDRGSVTLTFPGPHATLELWRSSSEFCAMRSLTMVSLAQRMISLSRSSSAASSALSAFYTRKFAEIVPDIKPPSLQLLVSFWQDESEHVRMSARSLFHCAASRAIPPPLCGQKVRHAYTEFLPIIIDDADEGKHKLLNTDETSSNNLLNEVTTRGDSQAEESSIVAWLESFHMQDWVSCVGGTRQDAMASLIIVAAASAVWYPSLVRRSVAALVVHRLMKLVMAMSEKYSSTAAELLAEGMEGTWKACIGPEIPRIIGDIFFQIECVSGASANSSIQNPAVSVTMQETLVGVLLPSLAMADISGFLNVIESQIWSTASDSPVHLVSLMTLIRVVRGSPKPLAEFLDKVVNFILQTMDYGNSVLRKACLPSSMAALKEVVRVYPMVSLNEASTRLAVGDAIGHIHNVTIQIYDMQSVTKIKVLDASGPPGLPSLLGRSSEMMVTTAISALTFSPDGEGIVAFSEHGLMIRWWSLEYAWWEKLSRSLVPIQCTKLIFVPPWEGFSPNSFRSSIMASIAGHDRQMNSPDRTRGSNDPESLKILLHNLDLTYRLEWVNERKVILTQHGQELGSFQL